MSSHGAYYYNTTKPEARPDAPSRREECRSPPPTSRYGDRPVTAFQRRRSITPPDGEVRRVPYYQEMERPRNPGSTDERLYSERPSTAYVPPGTVPFVAAPSRPPERQQRAESPDPSIFSEISEPEINPNYTSVDYYTYSKCLERVISDPNLAMPVRLGLIGKWGAGKSKIMKGVLWCLKQACDTTCSHISEPVDAPRNVNWRYRTCSCCDMSFFTYLFLLFVLLLFITAAILLSFILGVAPVVITSVETVTTSATSTGSLNDITAAPLMDPTSPESIGLIVTVSIAALLLLIICIVGLFKCLKDRYLRGVGDMLSHFRALVVMTLCDTPPPPEDTTSKVEIIPVCFNASEYADADDCWSALTKQMLGQCEEMFGFWKSRLYRICNKDLEHEHDFLIADEERWRHCGQEKGGPGAHRSLASAVPTGKADKGGRSARIKSGRIPNGTAVKPPGYWKSSLKTKSNKVVATDDNYDKKIGVPVHTAKWRSIGYPMLITIGIASVISATVILIIISLGVDVSSTTQTYHYIILSFASTVIALMVIILLRSVVVLLHSACTSPEQRIERLRKMARSDQRHAVGSHGFMHKVKEEVVILMGFLRYMEHIYQRRFRILLTIEDLDKCPDMRILDTFNAVKVLFGDPSFPIVTMISMDAELISKALSRAGVDSSPTYINQFMNMRFCVPDSSQRDILKLLESQAEHLLCSTSVRVNRLKELSDRKYNTSTYHVSRRDAIRQLDIQHDYEEKPQLMGAGHPHYYSHPVSGRHISTSRSRRSKSSKSVKKRVLFTPLRSTSEDGLVDPPSLSAKASSPPATIDKAVIPPVKTEPTTEPASPPEGRRSQTGGEKRPTTAERPDSELAGRVKSPPLGVTRCDMRREDSILAEESSEEEEEEDPEWMLAMTSGEARKDTTKGLVSTRRPQVADSEKTDEQLAEQHIHAVAEMKVMLGVSQGLITALVNNPSYELSVSYDSGLGSIKNMPLHVNMQALSHDQLRRHILAYGLRRRMVYLALDEVRYNIRLLDSTFTRMSQLFNTVYLSVYIWIQRLKQLGIADSIMNEKESDKAIVKIIKSCQELTRWVMICELWPYRASWLMYKVERVNRKMGDFPSSSFYLEASIRDIYKDIRPDIRAAREEFEVWNSADYSDTTFKKCLERFKDISGLSVLRYLPFTINVDRVYKNTINQYMCAGGRHVRTLQQDDESQHLSQKGVSLAGDVDTAPPPVEHT